MYTGSIILASGALVSLVAAVPMAKRDVVWVTDVVEEVVTLSVTETVWLGQGHTPPAPTANPTHYGHYGHHGKPQNSAAASAPAPVASSSVAVSQPLPSSSAPSVYVAPTTSSSASPAPSTSSSEYVAPPPAPTSSSSVYVAPAPSSTSSVYVAPAPSSTSSVYVAPAASASSAPAAAATYASSGSDGSALSSGLAAAGKSYTGDLTYYAPGLGACGMTNTASEHIVAVSHVIFDSYPAANSNDNPVCGKYVNIIGKDGSSYQAKVVDRCVGCAESDLDLSPDFFNLVTNNGDGRVPDMKWSWV